MGEMIEFPANGRTGAGYLARAGADDAPGVIVIQEWWGLVGHIKAVADRFAAAGYTALAPDLYHGVTTTEPDEAGKLLMALNIAEADKDVRGAIVRLRDLTGGRPVGTVGFCMGGALSLFAACANPDAVGACVDFYGGHPAVHYDLAALRAPVLGLFGERDEWISPTVVKELDAAIDGAGYVPRVRHLPRRRPRLLQRRSSGGLRRERGRGRLAPQCSPSTTQLR